MRKFAPNCKARFANMANTIEHHGIVENIAGTHIQVRIVQTSACATCSIKGHCTSADTKEKLIDVVDEQAASYRPGDSVRVIGSVSMGMQAVALAFVVPLLLLVVSLFVSVSVGLSEPLAIGCSLMVVAVYYLLVWFCRERVGKRFSFSILPVGSTHGYSPNFNHNNNQ